MNLTRDFPKSREVYFDFARQGLTTFERYSNRRGFIGGLSVELDLAKGLSLEGNALRRQLQLEHRFIFPDGNVLENGTLSDIGTWEFPVLLKYCLPAVRAVRPFIETGPSFRTRHNPGASEPSQVGGTLGTGVEVRAGRLRVSPALRYTRWQKDPDYPRVATKRDQIEFVTTISYATSVPSWRVGGKKLRFGLIGGTPFTSGLEQPLPPQRTDELQGYMAGLAIELELDRHWSFEVNGLYRPFHANTVTVHPQFGELRNEFTVLTWQFPLLAKYRFSPDATVRPVIQAGPSFRLSGNRNGYNPSTFGITIGGGIETDYKALRITPTVRYTRWAADSRPWFMNADVARNQVEALVSLTF